VRDDREVRAVVLRVDSPGGDVLASDLVADAVQRCRKEKPVIVSQAMVAASGGYWVSMYGDSIVAAPNTITGSIGVIGGWVYDRGLKEELGLSTDHVQAGDHADLGFGLRLFGLELPDRNLTAVERARVDTAMRSLYDDFIAKVAIGRRRTATAIDSVGQGRVWSGRRAVEHGLVDRLGGLDTALRMAAAKAGLDPDRPLELIERPRLGLRDLTLSRTGLPELRRSREESLAYLRFRLDHNGLPLLLLPTDGRTGFLPRP
jgi:protease-4